MLRSLPLSHFVQQDERAFPKYRGSILAAYSGPIDKASSEALPLAVIGDLPKDVPKKADMYRFLSRLVAVPSYNPLNTVFFTGIRQVPLYVLGLFDMTYLIADGITQTTLGFHVHDAFHVLGFRGDDTRQLWGTHLAALGMAGIIDLTKDEAARSDDELKAELEAELVAYGIWDANAKLLDAAGKSLTVPALREAFDTLLFSVLHEPITGAEALADVLTRLEKNLPRASGQSDDARKVELTQLSELLFESIRGPAVLERSAIRVRLASQRFLPDQRTKMGNLYFGHIMASEIAQLDNAVTEILKVVNDAKFKTIYPSSVNERLNEAVDAFIAG